MKKHIIFLSLFILPAISGLYSQTPQISTPVLDFDGQKLRITYELVNASESDKFNVWMLIRKKNGDQLKIKTVSGDLGDINGEGTKIITWEPAKDSVFLNEEISVELQAEKYVKEYNKGSAFMLSVLMPGLGQTKMNNGKPYWLMGVASYGALAGGLVTYSGYKKSYDSYLLEESDSQKRADYLSKAEKQATMAGAMLVTAAVLWTANLIWVYAAPNRYQTLKYRPLTITPSAEPGIRAALLTLQYKF